MRIRKPKIESFEFFNNSTFRSSKSKSFRSSLKSHSQWVTLYFIGKIRERYRKVILEFLIDNMWREGRILGQEEGRTDIIKMHLHSTRHIKGASTQIQPHFTQSHQIFKTGSTLKCRNALGLDFTALTRKCFSVALYMYILA